MVKATQMKRVGPIFVDFERRFRQKIEPMLGRRISSRELSDRVGKLMIEIDVIEMSARQVRRKKRRGLL